MMQDLTLLFSSGLEQVDNILQGVVGLFETVFPGRIRAYYLSGSYTNATAVTLSDLDLFVIVKEDFRDKQEDELLEKVKKYCSLISPIRLDLSLFSEKLLYSGQYSLGVVMLKRGGSLLYGTDFRESLPLPDFQSYLKAVMERASLVLKNLHSTSTPTYPLSYPDPQAEFYGYEYKRIDHWYPAQIKQGTKELCAGVSWLASAIIFLKTGSMLGLKSEVVDFYTSQIGGEWATLVEQIYTKCKLEWRYLIPTQPEDRAVLRSLCARLPDFENYYLNLLEAYLKSISQGDDPELKTWAAAQLKQPGKIV